MINSFRRLKDRIQGKAAPGEKRSGRWRKVRKDFIEANPTCFVCGGSKKVEVHHVIPFSVAPDLELDPSNLVSLCEAKKYGLNCHLLIGHLGNYRRTNPNFWTDAISWSMKLGKVDLNDLRKMR